MNSAVCLKVPQEWTRKLSREEVNQLPVKRWNGPIQLLRTDAEAEEAVAVLARESVLGFDTETRPSFRKGENYFPALLQLAGADTVYLFQLRAMERFVGLAALLSDPKCRKVGVGLDYDVRALQSLFPFDPKGFLDVGDVARRTSIASQGLRGLAANLFGMRISKRAQCSNWDNPELKKFQLVYAATDAWISREIYLTMCDRGVLPPLVRPEELRSDQGSGVNAA
ncbi:MAG: 3'-5' exonuclease domain-containing protein 2 [Magnetococcales bacterium]|nr:3'-5' exonuclease domain-containing protein 2 [Magnetococcales bacterium]NGZ06638.1 3'-5' exonuclease domain-containing protein 2 [Magnetococcales bacterium]